jgi:hypothetical protein
LVYDGFIPKRTFKKCLQNFWQNYPVIIKYYLKQY